MPQSTRFDLSVFNAMTVFLVGVCSSLGVSRVAAEDIKLLFTYGSEKDAWLKEVNKSFKEAGLKTASGKTIVVELVQGQKTAFGRLGHDLVLPH